MKDIHLHTVVVEYKNLEILSADTDFYAFVGHERFFATFESLIHPDSRETFRNIVENRSTKSFVLDMVTEDGSVFSVYMHIAYEKDKMTISLEALRELYEGQELYYKLSNIDQDLLGLHNDTIFTYDSEKECVKLYSPDFRRCVKVYTTEGFLEEIKSNIDEEEYDILSELKSSLKSRTGSFAHTFTGNILSHTSPCKKSIVKGLMVNDFEGITTIGYVHRGSSKNNATYTLEMDALTGVYSKREIANTARKLIEVEKRNVALCIMDVDHFKSVNDSYGHMKGDELLKEIANIIKTEVGSSGVVGRFGGDEFFVIFYDVEDMFLCREKLRSIKNQVAVKYSSAENEDAFNVTVSIGCAVYPKDSSSYEDTFALADYCLYMAKDKGRNRYVIYNKEQHGTFEEIKERFDNRRRIDSRKESAMGDVLSMISDKHYQDNDYTPEMLVDDLVDNLNIERIVCLTGKPPKCRCMAGINLPSVDVINKSVAILNSGNAADFFKDDIIVISNIERLKNISEDMYKAYLALNVKSCLLVRFWDAVGKESILCLEMTTNYVSWDESQMYNYRNMARMFSRFEL